MRISSVTLSAWSLTRLTAGSRLQLCAGSSEEIVQVVKFAAAEKLAMVVMGARTKLRIGLPPRQFDLALDMTRLNRVLAYDPGDLTLSIEAGVPLCDVQRTLAEPGQFLPLEVPFMNRTTVGGTI